MPKKLPTRSARTYSRQFHRAETEALIEEEFYDSEIAGPNWVDPDPANDQEPTLASLMGTATPDASTPTNGDTPAVYEVGPATTPTHNPFETATARTSEPSQPTVAGEPSVHLQEGPTAIATKPDPMPMGGITPQGAVTERHEPTKTLVGRIIDGIANFLSR